MKRFKKALTLLLAAAMVLCSLAACSPQSTIDAAKSGGAAWDGTPQYGGHLNVRMLSLKMLDPTKNASTWRYMYTTAIYEPFLTRDAQNNIQPAVCDFVLSEDQTDLKLWPREGYTFSRGYGPVEMDDIVASFDRATVLHANTKKYLLPNVISAEVEMDPELGHEVFHIKFNYNEKNMYLLATAKPWAPVMPKEICEKYEGEYIDDQIEDVVGTGPYIVTDFKSGVYCTIVKRDDYVPVEADKDKTGLARTKYGYMDSITFLEYTDDAAAANAVLSGQLDMTEVVPKDYADLAAQSGVKLTKLVSDQRVWIRFNCVGENNLVAKYPSLRKAIMAAIDYETYAGYITDYSLVMEGDTIMFGDDGYDKATSKFKEADYYGAYNQAVVDKYMAQAREEGYNGEKIQVPVQSHRTDIATLTEAQLKQAGIPYEMVSLESATYDDFVGEVDNNWDFNFQWAQVYATPTGLTDAQVLTYWEHERINELRSELYTVLPGSDEALAIWDEMTDIWVEECLSGYIGAIDWWWWHPETLHINDGGDDPNDGNTLRFVYNCYWEDPQNHTAQFAG